MKFIALAVLTSETLAVSLNRFVDTPEYFDRQFDEPQVNKFDGYIHLSNGKKLDGKTFDEVQDDDLNVMTSFIENFEQDLDLQQFSGEPIGLIQQRVSVPEGISLAENGMYYNQYGRPLDDK